MKPDAQVSKLISYWLRHNPEDAGLIPDEYGWVPLSALLAALAGKGHPISVVELIALNQSFDKVRFAIDEVQDRMRATHGHSFAVVPDEAGVPPALLYHGTAERFVGAIKTQGLLPMQRQFVHLAAETATAMQVAQRHGKPVLIRVATAPLLEAGWEFYQTSDKVWLTRGIPPQYLEIQG